MNKATKALFAVADTAAKMAALGEDGLAEKIIFLLQHPKVARQMGSHGLQLVEEFDSRRMVRQQEELYLYLARRAPQKSS